MTTTENKPLPYSTHRIQDIENLNHGLQEQYRTAIDTATSSIGKEQTIKRSIQQAALILEEIHKLSNQEWAINTIGSRIVKDLKMRGFPESKYIYVFKALHEYGDRFVEPVQHSSSQSLAPASKQLEIFHRANAQKYYDALAVIKQFQFEYHILDKKDIQTIVPELLDIYDKNEKLCKYEGIQIVGNKADDFDGGPEKFKDPLRIPKTTPEVPVVLKEELDTWMTIFLPSLLKKFTEYPIKDKELEKRITAGWCALRHSYDPITDDKYRRTFPDWIEIVEAATRGFKHQAASQFKSQSFKGEWRKLTREQIGSRQRTIPLWCKWFFNLLPGFMEGVVWSRTYREPRLNEFSINLAPKLSDRSIK